MRKNPTPYKEILSLYRRGARSNLGFSDVPVAMVYVTNLDKLNKAFKPPSIKDGQKARRHYFDWAKQALYELRYLVRSLKAQIVKSHANGNTDMGTFQAIMKMIAEVEPFFGDLGTLTKTSFDDFALGKSQIPVVDNTISRCWKIREKTHFLAIFLVMRNKQPPDLPL